MFFDISLIPLSVLIIVGQLKKGPRVIACLSGVRYLGGSPAVVRALAEVQRVAWGTLRECYCPNHY